MTTAFASPDDMQREEKIAQLVRFAERGHLDALKAFHDVYEIAPEEAHADGGPAFNKAIENEDVQMFAWLCATFGEEESLRRRPSREPPRE